MMSFMAKEIELPIMVSKKETLGQRLRKIRKQRGFSQTELAEVIASSQRAICSYEQDRTAPPAHLLPKMAKAFGISLDELMGLTPKDIQENGNRSSRWSRKFEQLERLPERKQRTIMQVLDMALKSTG
jgi:transcriptional regulator with XRE-family HTH domain